MIPLPFNQQEINECKACGNYKCGTTNVIQTVSEDKKTITIDCKKCDKTTILHVYDFGSGNRGIYMSLEDLKGKSNILVESIYK